MNAATMQLILALLPVAEHIIFSIGGQLVKIAVADLNTPEAIASALETAKTAGFPQLSFMPVAAPAASLTPVAPAAPAGAEQV
jgi:hypothetical protein